MSIMEYFKLSNHAAKEQEGGEREGGREGKL